MYKYNMGGSVPRETNIAGQRHSLAYINPFEEDLLNTQYRGGEGQPVPPVPGPGGVPSYRPTLRDVEEASKVPAPSNPGDRSGSGNKAFDTAQKTMTVGAGRGTSSGSSTVSNTGPSIAAQVAQMSGRGNKEDNTSTVSVRPQTRPADLPAVVKRENSRLEGLANVLTPNDMMEYVNGQLVYGPKHPKAGQSVDPNATNSFGFKVGMGNTNANDYIPGQYNQGFGSGIKTDLDMSFAAGGGTREEKLARLMAAGYGEEAAAAYLDKTEASLANSQMNTGGGGGDEQNNIIGELAAEVVDPCPEGYKMDPETNACVIDPDIGMGPPVFTPSDPNAGSPGSPGYTQPIGNFIPTPLQPNPVNPMQQQLNNITRSLQPQQNQQMAGGLAGIRR